MCGVVGWAPCLQIQHVWCSGVSFMLADTTWWCSGVSSMLADTTCMDVFKCLNLIIIGGCRKVVFKPNIILPVGDTFTFVFLWKSTFLRLSCTYPIRKLHRCPKIGVSSFLLLRWLFFFSYCFFNFVCPLYLLGVDNLFTLPFSFH